MSNQAQFYLIFSNGVTWLILMLDLGGFGVCLAYRRLSPRLIVASAGFAGLAASGAVARLALILFDSSQERLFFSFLLASGGGLVSTSLLIFGLASSFAEIRRKLALALEPPHVRK